MFSRFSAALDSAGFQADAHENQPVLGPEPVAAVAPCGALAHIEMSPDLSTALHGQFCPGGL